MSLGMAAGLMVLLIAAGRGTERSSELSFEQTFCLMDTYPCSPVFLDRDQTPQVDEANKPVINPVANIERARN